MLEFRLKEKKYSNLHLFKLKNELEENEIEEFVDKLKEIGKITFRDYFEKKQFLDKFLLSALVLFE